MLVQVLVGTRTERRDLVINARGGPSVAGFSHVRKLKRFTYKAYNKRPAKDM